MTTVEFDPVAFKEQQRVNWDALSGAWESWQDTFELGAAPVTRRLLDLGGVRTGQTVLDVGCGVGEPALSAARAVGPTGRVVGVDLAPDMVARARRRAAGAGNVEFVVGDVDRLLLRAGSFDVVLSRWGLMFAVDRVAAFRELARLLVPGGVLAAAVWGPPQENPMMSLGFGVLSRLLDLPPPPSPPPPGPFSLSDPARAADELRAAGFAAVTTGEVEVCFRLRSVEEFVEFTRAVTPVGMRALLRERLGSEDDPRAWRAVAEAASAYEVAGGAAELPGRALWLRAETATPR